MDIGTIIALVVASLTLLWTIYRDKSGDTNDLMSRVSGIEMKMILVDSSIERLEAEQDEMKKMLKSLEAQINNMNLKVERILTILEQKQP